MSNKQMKKTNVKKTESFNLSDLGNIKLAKADKETTSSSETSSSESSRYVPMYRRRQIARDSEKLRVYHVNALSVALAEAGFDKDIIMRIHEYHSILNEVGGKLPKEESDLEEYAETVEQLSLMTHEERVQFRDSLTLGKETLIADYSAMLHALDIKGLVFINPVKERIYTASPKFASYVMAHPEGYLAFKDIAEESLRTLLINIKDVLSTKKDSGLVAALQQNMVDITGISTIRNFTIVPSRMMGHTRVQSGTVRSDVVLPFSYPQTRNIPTKTMNKHLIAKAVQDLTGKIPVDISKSASCSHAIETYEDDTYVVTESEEVNDRVVPTKIAKETRTYYYPITLAVEGYAGDALTTDILKEHFREEPYYDNSMDDSKYFKPMSDLIPMPEGNFVDVDRVRVSRVQYSDDFDYSPESRVWKFLEDSGSVRMGDLEFLLMNYKHTVPNDFASTSGIKIIDFATFNVLYKDYASAVKKHVMILLSPSSQTVLAIPRKMIVDPLIRFGMNDKNLNTNFAHPRYPILWKGIGTKMPMMCSAFFVSGVITHYVKPDIAMDLKKENWKEHYASAFQGKKSRVVKKKSRIPATETAMSMFDVFFQMESYQGLVSAFGVKSESTRAAAAFTSLGEKDQGGDDHSDSGDDSKSENEHAFDVSDLLTPIRKRAVPIILEEGDGDTEDSDALNSPDSDSIDDDLDTDQSDGDDPIDIDDTDQTEGLDNHQD